MNLTLLVMMGFLPGASPVVTAASTPSLRFWRAPSPARQWANAGPPRAWKGPQPPRIVGGPSS